jgi:superfamily II DNA or RNA helicase
MTDPQPLETSVEQTAPSLVTPAGFAEHEARIRALPEEKQRGDAFEQLVQRFLERDPAIRSGQGIARVWLWADWPDRVRYYPQEPEGLGIDHVIETCDGALLGVQAKFVSDPTRSSSYADLASFINRVVSPGSPFTGGLLVTNAYTTAKKVEREFHAAQTIGITLRDALIDSTIDWSADAPPAARPPYLRRPDQAAAITDVISTLQTHDRTKLIAACGTGKTLMSYWVARDLAAERILVLLPSLALVRQFRTEWAEAANREGWSPAIYAVCSENDRGGDDAPLLRADELGVRMIATPDTDPDVIAGWLRRPGPAVVFSTYQSSPRIAEAMGDPAIAPFDLTVADEAHNIVTAKSASAFRTVIDGDRIRSQRRLFVTATEKFFSERVKTKAADEGVALVSMDDEAQFGPLAHQISFAQAIDLQLITDYQIVIAEIAEDDPELAELIATRRFVDAVGVETTDAATLAAGLALARAAQELGFHRTISFHTRAKRGSGASQAAGAEAFADLMRTLEPAWRVAFVSGEQTSAARAETVRHTLVGPERGLVTNARCMGEGVDLPDLEAVAFVDPRSSTIDIVQSVSRALRRPRTIEKPFGYILIPVIIPKGVDLALALQRNAYAQVYRVTQAMRSHDERLAEEIDRLKTTGGCRPLAARSLESLIVRTGEVGSHAIDLATWRRQIAISIVERTHDRFAVGIAALGVYHAAHGHIRVPRSYCDQNGFPLGQWVAQMIAAYSGAPFRRLSSKQRSALTKLGMTPWKKKTGGFAVGIAALGVYHAAHGHIRVPKNYRDQNGFPLGVWLLNQTAAYNGSPWRARLSQERIAALEKLGMTPQKKKAGGFAVGIAALGVYHAAHGHIRVPRSYRDQNGFPLGIWLLNQRAAYNGSPRRPRLSQGRVAALEKLGMTPLTKKKIDARPRNKKWTSMDKLARGLVRSALVLDKA